MSTSLPHIILIVLDSVRRDHVGCYGYARPTTPNIDRLAGNGILFERAYASSCWTIPAHASLFTGLYPSQHRADFETFDLDPGATTIASFLKGRGYRTACISCNSFPTDHALLRRGFDLTVDVERPWDSVRGAGARVLRGLHRRWRQWTGRDRGARRATTLARRWLSEQERGRPFFLFMNYMECHLPYRLRRAERYRFVPRGERRRVARVPQDPFACMAGKLKLTEQDRIDLQALYDGSLLYLDEQVGVLDASLQELGLSDRTIFIVTSDHGESFGEHGLHDHQYGLYEHLIAVPLVMRLPGRERAGTLRWTFVQHTDLLPTLAHWVDGTGVPECTGLSLFDRPGREVVVAEYLVPNVAAIRRRFPDVDPTPFDAPLRSIREGDFKLIERRGGQPELYELSEDPAEIRNLAATRPDVMTRLRSRLASLVGEWPGETREAAHHRLPAEIRERLEALGYL